MTGNIPPLLLGGSGAMVYAPPNMVNPSALSYPPFETMTEVQLYSVRDNAQPHVSSYFANRFQVPSLAPEYAPSYSITSNVNFWLAPTAAPDLQLSNLAQIKDVLSNHDHWVASELSVDFQSLAYYIVDYGTYTMISNGDPHWIGIDLESMVFYQSTSRVVPIIQEWWYNDHEGQIVPVEKLKAELGKLSVV